MFKILNGYENIESNIFFEINESKITRGHNYTLVKKQSRLDVRKYSFSQRTINVWNKLSTDCVHASTVVPATAGHRWFRGKVALRGRWPLVTGNGHMRHYVKSNTLQTAYNYFTAHAQHYKVQRSITMLYTVRDETNNAENV